MAFLLKCVPRRPRQLHTIKQFIPRRISGVAEGTLKFSEEVQQAKAEGRPIVALESTIITHGMPYPQNFETAVQVENIIRERGAIPATIAILSGQLTVGLTEDKLRYLSQAHEVVKTSRRDMAHVVASKLDGGTTVAGTLVAAGLAHIPIFVTGGIGGVHREGQSTLDVSADLIELGRSPTLLVCGGAKSILDIGRTLEYLETQGVCVCSYGESDEFPAFYTTRSGHRAPYRLTSALDAARLLHASQSLRLGSGILVAVPVPSEYAMDEAVVEGAISRALDEARSRGVKGKQVTPFLLTAVAEATAGASLDTNIALINNNAKVGADIAVAYNKMNKNSTSTIFSRKFHTSVKNYRSEDFNKIDRTRTGPVVVIGGSNIDKTYRVTEDNIKLDGSTYACTRSECGGGVARNMAEALWRMRGGRVRLVTALGDDAAGRHIQHIAPGLILDGSVVAGARSASYAAVLDKRGECVLGLGDMALHDHISIDMIDRHKELIAQAPLLVLDGNAPQHTIDYVMHLARQLQTPVFFDPTDKRKAIKPFIGKNKIYFASPNISELRAIAGVIGKSHQCTYNLDLISESVELCKTVSQYVNFLIITLNSLGVMTVKPKRVLGKTSQSNLIVRMYPIKVVKSIKSVSGAGDCFSSGFIHGLLCGLTEEQCIAIGFEAAKAALNALNTVPEEFNSQIVEDAEYKEIIYKI